MTPTPPAPVVEVESLVKRVVSDAAIAASAVLVALGALPALLQAAGVAHISVPAAVTTYATIAVTVLTSFVSWARNRGYVTTKRAA